jgi:serine phosphatase RsbU (regulator of sigma subunit)
VALEQARLLEDIRHSHLLDASIALARNIQASFLPAQLPIRPGYELAAWWQPAEEVAGDYYDVIPLSDGHLALAMADVSGHGVGPSLIMAAARAMLHVLARRRTEPGQILTLLSETISPDLNDGRFITFFLAALDTDNHSLTFANAGHFPALHYESGTGTFHVLKTTGLPLGVWLELEFPAGVAVALEPGDIIVLATDGAIEQHNQANEMFGVERLKSIVAEHRDATASEIVGFVRTALTEFFTAKDPDDDITLLVVKREPGGSQTSSV